MKFDGEIVTVSIFEGSIQLSQACEVEDSNPGLEGISDKVIYSCLMTRPNCETILQVFKFVIYFSKFVYNII